MLWRYAAIANLPGRELQRNTPPATLDEDNAGNKADGQNDQGEKAPARQQPRPAQFDRRGGFGRKVHHDADTEDQGEAIADAAQRDLLAEPDQKNRTGRKRKGRGYDK